MPSLNGKSILRMLFRTRAFALALLLNVGVIVGLMFGAVAFAGAASPPDVQGRAYAAAAKAGLVGAQSPATPPVKSSAAPIVHPALAAPAAALKPSLKPAPGSLDCLAAAVYYEARGESADGRAAVAQVVLNRTRRAGFPRSICGVVYQGAGDGACQFSFVCNGAMHSRREQGAWLDARRIAARALAGHVMSAIGRAVSFHAARGPSPSGAVRLGGHLFFT